MKVTVFTDPQLEEDYTDIHCQSPTRMVRDIVEYINGYGGELWGKLDGEDHRLSVNDILYFESIDKKSFAYTREQVFEIGQPLKKLEELYEGAGFVRISKSFIVNIYQIDHIKYDFEMRILAHLVNQEVLIINRSYKKAFQNSLTRIKEKMTGGSSHADQ